MSPFEAIANASTQTVGTKTTPSKTSSGRLYVEADPDALASAAGVSLDVYAVARMCASEKYSGTAPELLALAEAARNHAGTRSPASMLLYAKDAESNGYFGEQAAGRWASTRLDPNGRHIAAARAAIEEETATARGAVDFFDPGSQRVGASQGSGIIRKSAETYIANNAAAGLEWIGPLDGVDATGLMLFAKKAKASPAAALAYLHAASGGALVVGLALIGYLVLA